MVLHQQGRARTTGRWTGLTLTGWVLLGCNLNATLDERYPWPTPTALVIWAVEPNANQVLGYDGDPLTLRWNVSVPNGVEARVSLRLVPQDANLDSASLASGIIPVPGGAADQWPFSGRDTNGELVPAQVYQVEYTIDDGAGTSHTTTSTGSITVPLRFTSPAEHTEIDLAALQSEGLNIEWEGMAFATPGDIGIERLDVGLSTDPNSPNDIVWVNRGADFFLGMNFGLNSPFTGMVFDETDLDGDDANSHLIEPDSYAIVGRVTPAGGGQVRFYVQGPARVTILPDPNS